MSEYYHHFLVSEPSDYCPAAIAVADFLGGLIEDGHVASNPKIVFSKVARCEPSVRKT